MFSIDHKGDYESTRAWLKKLTKGGLFDELDKYGQMGVDALAKATPVDSRLTAGSWRYRVRSGNGYSSIEWYNTNIDADGTPVAILIQYGHATGTGGYVQGRDYINPAMRPVFDKIAAEMRRKVSR